MSLFELFIDDELTFETTEAMHEFVREVHGKDGIRIRVSSDRACWVQEGPERPVEAPAAPEAPAVPEEPEKPAEVHRGPGRPRKTAEPEPELAAEEIST